MRGGPRRGIVHVCPGSPTFLDLGHPKSKLFALHNCAPRMSSNAGERKSGDQIRSGPIMNRAGLHKIRGVQDAGGWILAVS